MSFRLKSLSAKDLDVILQWRQRSQTDFHTETKEERDTFIKIQAMLIYQREEAELWHRRFS
jgi:hypothetical protein